MTFDDFHPLAGLIESLPEDVPVDEPETEETGAPNNGSARTARERRDAAARKRDERARRRAVGMPEQRSVDAVLVSALAEVCRRRGFRQRIRETKTVAGNGFTLQDILGEAMQQLVEGRGVGQVQAKNALLLRLGLVR